MKIFDCHSDTMADIRNRVFAGAHDIIRTRHLPLYDKGGVSGLKAAFGGSKWNRTGVKPS